MLSARTQNQFGTWGIPGRKPVIVYGIALVERLAAEAGQASPKPVGGVLFGSAGDQDIRVTAFRPVECVAGEEDVSPFTEAGELDLDHLATVPQNDPELAGLQPVGWYRSRWESAIQLNHEDLRVWNRYFPEPTQVSLVLRVQKDSPVRAGFFFRPQNGGPVRIDSSYRTFEIDPGADVGRLAEAVKSGGMPLLPPPTEEPVGLAPPPELFTPPAPAPDRLRYLWALACLLSAAVVSLVAFSWWRSGSHLPQPTQDVSLRFKGSPDRLALVWNPKAALIRGAKRAELRLIDGDSDRTELLTPPELLSGERRLANRSGRVEAQLRILTTAPTIANSVVAAQFVGPAAGDVRPPGHAGPALDLGPIRAEKKTLKTSIDALLKSNGLLEKRIRKLRDLFARRDQGKQPVLALVSPPPPAPPKSEPVAAAVPQTAVAVEPPPLSFGTDRAPVRAPAPASEPPAASAYTGPSSGKFIWTGYLAPGRTVTIDGRRASTGSVNGSLPGVPVRVSVYPGEFSTSGLSVFSAAPRHQSGTVTEGRSAQNGWLNTRYVYDPARARDAQLGAAPAEAGGFKQLQFVGGERPVSVVVVEWSVAR